MVKPPSSAKTRLGEWMPSFFLNQLAVLSPTSVMAFFTALSLLRMPVTRPSSSMPPSSVKRAGRSTPK
ncbi:hypothetical protein D3C76_1522200 [compost metagenome]